MSGNVRLAHITLSLDKHDAKDSVRRILLPDVRVAAGDIISHVVYRHEIAKIRAASYRNVDAKEGVVAPDGTVLIWPAWARGVVQHHEYGCERSERALYVRVAPMAMPS